MYFIALLLLSSTFSLCVSASESFVSDVKFNCSRYNNSCSECKLHEECYWCQWTKECASVENLNYFSNCSNIGWCSGDSCTCGLFPATGSLASMILMMLFYGAILAFGAKMIADGAEELLELFPDASTIIGGLLLPVLGGLPDGIMILVSGLFANSRAEAQDQVSVGMGTLAGSTIMLLTVPWAASLILGRCDFDREGNAIDKQLNTPFFWRGWLNTGITLDDDTKINARIAFGASSLFLLGQIVAFFYLFRETTTPAVALENKVALAGLILCALALVAYIIYQLMIPKLAEMRKAKAEEIANEKKVFYQTTLVIKRLRENAGLILPVEKTEEQKKIDDNAAALRMANVWKAKLMQKKEKEETEPLKTPININETETKEPEGDEEEPFWMRLSKAIFFSLFGTVLVAFFSDPMVDVITRVGLQLNIGAFYVSFVITPLCSNASELIASLVFAMSKTKQSASMTYSQLYGAATMNSTLGLGIFYGLIYFRQLSWTFSAETLAILVITWTVCAVGSFKQSFSCLWAIPSLLLYPLSLLLVWIFQEKLGLDH